MPAGHGEAVAGAGAGGCFSEACGASGEGRAREGGWVVGEPAYVD